MLLLHNVAPVRLQVNYNVTFWSDQLIILLRKKTRFWGQGITTLNANYTQMQIWRRLCSKPGLVPIVEVRYCLQHTTDIALSLGKKTDAALRMWLHTFDRTCPDHCLNSTKIGLTWNTRKRVIFCCWFLMGSFTINLWLDNFRIKIIMKTTRIFQLSKSLIWSNYHIFPETT